MIANDAYHRHSADIVVGEKNFGGDMVRAVLQSNNPDLPYKHVNASRGKVVRAEPVSILYEKQRVMHVGYFTELEDQLCGFSVSGFNGMKSPDRADALVWGITELFPRITESQETRNWTPPNKVTYNRSAARFDRRV